MRHPFLFVMTAILAVSGFGAGAASCAFDLTRARVVPHPAWGPPPTFKSLVHARVKIDKNRYHLRRYLEPAQYDRMERLLVSSDHNHQTVNAYLLPALTEIFDRAVDAFATELRTELPSTEARLLSEAAEAERLGHHSLRITIERLVAQLNAIAKTMNFTLGVELWAQAPRTLAEARAILHAVSERSIHPPLRPVDAVAGLTVLGSSEARDAFRRALEIAFDDEEATARELRRLGKRALGHVDTYGRVPDLDRALGLFVAPPTLEPCDSKVCLSGSAPVAGRPTPVMVTFDPRERYFTVQTPTRRYYELAVEADGRMTFLPSAPVSINTSAKRLATTHFSY